MASLLAKFRIDYSDLKVIPDITKKPLETTVSFFESLISEFKQPEGIADSGSSSDPSKLWKSHYIWNHVYVCLLLEEAEVEEIKK